MSGKPACGKTRRGIGRDPEEVLVESLKTVGKCVLAAATGLMLGLAPASAQTEDWAKVVDAAKQEGTLVLYTAFVGQPSTRLVADAFTAEFGIPVEILEARASEIRERVRVEQAAGRFAADVLFTSDSQTKVYVAEDKSVAPIPPSPSQPKVKESFDMGDLPFAPVMIIPYGILANTNLVSEADMPKKWADLTDPKWQDKILADDPRASGGGYATFFVTHEALGEEYHHQMAKQKPVFTRDQRESQRRVARGEYALYIPLILTDAAGLKGLPVKAIVPEEGVPYVLYGNVLLKNAPHPNAARLYIDFLQSPKAQAIYAAQGHGVVTEGAGEGLPDELRAIVDAPLLGKTDPARLTEMMAKAKNIYGE